MRPFSIADTASRAGAELKYRDFLVGIDADLAQRRAQIKMGRRAEPSHRGGFALQLRRRFDFRPGD